MIGCFFKSCIGKRYGRAIKTSCCNQCPNYKCCGALSACSFFRSNGSRLATKWFLWRIFVNQSAKLLLESMCDGIATEQLRTSRTHACRTSMCFIRLLVVVFFMNASATVLSINITIGDGKCGICISWPTYHRTHAWTPWCRLRQHRFLTLQLICKAVVQTSQVGNLHWK